jgi:hypothetical protein
VIRPSIGQRRDLPQTLLETRSTMDGGNISIMSRRAYLSFADVEGKLDTLRVECTKWPGGGDPVGTPGSAAGQWMPPSLHFQV